MCDRVRVACVASGAALAFSIFTATAVLAQTPESSPDMPSARGASGPAWLPDATPMYAVHSRRGDCLLMAHGNVFVQFLRESGERGDDQFGSINWLMGMAERPAGPGRLVLRGMVSAEPWTIGGCGYPDLLAS